MSLRTTVVEQFRKPRGWLGRLAGWIMRNRPSNRVRNLWTVERLEIQPDSHVLEIGCGPGFALQACTARAHRGRVVGVDHSATMIGQARRRLCKAVEEGRVHLQLGGLEAVSSLGETFDKAFLVNVIQFLPEPAAAYGTLFATLEAGGTVATTYQPRHKNPTREDALNMVGKIRQAMRLAGFVDIRVEELPLRPAPAVCIIGTRPSTG